MRACVCACMPAIFFHVVYVCKLSSTKQCFYNVLGLLVLIIYLTPVFQDSLLIELLF